MPFKMVRNESDSKPNPNQPIKPSPSSGDSFQKSQNGGRGNGGNKETRLPKNQ